MRIFELTCQSVQDYWERGRTLTTSTGLQIADETAPHTTPEAIFIPRGTAESELPAWQSTADVRTVARGSHCLSGPIFRNMRFYRLRFD